MQGDGHLKTRRDAIRDIGASAFALLALTPTTAYAGTASSRVRGRVVNADAVSERGIPGVMVSNGRDVVLTDTRGAYDLPVRRGDMVFAIKPPHWRYPTRSGVPRMAYRVEDAHDARSPTSTAPEGAYVPAVSRGAKTVDFSFIPCHEADNFDVLLFTDTHAGDDRELGFTREMIRHGLEASDVAFAIHHGDALADNLAMFPAYRSMLAESGCLWHHCPGNHDMRLGVNDDEARLSAWRREIGPAHYAFRYGKSTFILLNNVEDLGPQSARHNSRPYRGFISRDQLRFVANVLAHVPKSDLVVLSMHIPLVSYVNPGAPTDTTRNCAALMQLLADRPNVISFAGHSHTTEHHYLGRAHGVSGATPHHHQVLTAACGSWWSGPLDESGVPIALSRDGSPKGHHVLSVRGTRTETRFVPYRPVEQVRALVEERRLLGVSSVSTALVNGRLVVNVFDGGPKTKVTCRIGGALAEPLLLTHAATEDPFIVDTFARERHLLKPWVYPAPCSHLWTINLPGDLPPGTHHIRVEAQGEFGQRNDHDLTISI